MSSYLALESSLRSPLYRKIANRPSCADPFLETSELNQCESSREFRELTPITAVQSGGNQVVTFRLPRGNLFLTDMVLRIDHGAMSTASMQTLEARNGAGYNAWDRITLDIGNTILATCYSDYAAHWIRSGAYPDEQRKALELMGGFANQTVRQSRVTAGTFFCICPFFFNNNQTALDLWATNSEINVNVHMRSPNAICDTADGGATFTAVKLLCNLHTVPEKVRNRHDQLAYSANKSSLCWDQGMLVKSLGALNLNSGQGAKTVNVELNGITGLVNTAYFYVVPTSFLTNRNTIATSSPYSAKKISTWKFTSLGNTIFEKFADAGEGKDINKLYHIIAKAPGCPTDRDSTDLNDPVENVQQLTVANNPYFRRGNTGAISFEYLSTPSIELVIPEQESLGSVDYSLVFMTETRTLLDQLIVAGTARKIHYRKITQ